MKGKRFAAFLLALVLLLNVSSPVFAVSAEAQSSNDVTVPVEEWTYTPTAQTATVLSTGDDSGESSADLIEVTVKAIDSTTSEEVTVGGATVNLYVGSTLISSTVDEDEDGKVEVSLAGLSIEERKNATISANKVVSRGKAIDGDARDLLFSQFPTDDSGDYYRYTMELHSETIDDNGNWLGAEIPEGNESNKVDIVFVVDATGSMSGEITNVKNNIASFSQNLIDSGLDIRFCIIDYRDITESEPTNVHTSAGSHWLTDLDAVTGALSSIDATGGGDTPETLLDPLGYVADNSLMSWRSDAYRFAFVLTDANYKTDNNYGYASMAEVTEKLAEMEVVTSVITSSSYQSTYTDLYTATGGIYANINSSSFDEEMLTLSDSIIESVTREMELLLLEPRMLVNLSVCYFANDATSMSASYRESVEDMLNEYSHRMAETTDGHVMIDKILLFSTNNRLNFYTPTQIASMADIRIETTEAESHTIHSNAKTNGFYTAQLAGADLGEEFPQFAFLADSLRMRASFWHIQMSGTEGANANKSMIDEAYQYSTTVMHETGHYLFGFFDEYMNANAEEWRDIGNKPYSAFGLMDNQRTDIEMSKNIIDYHYITSNNTPTYHWKVYSASCESTLADLLMTGETTYDDSQNRYTKNGEEYCFYYYELPSGGVFDKTGEDAEYGQYVINYNVAGSSDRTAGYSYAELSEDDFLDAVLPSAATTSTVASVLSVSAAAEESYASSAVADVTFTSNGETVSVSVSGDSSATYSLRLMKAGDEAFTSVALTDGKAALPIAEGELAEVHVVASTGDTASYNIYYIDRSGDTDTGYIYTSADNSVMAYVTTAESESYTFVADNTAYTNGDYVSMNQATWITSDSGLGFDSGEIYSVASYLAEIDYTSLTWFKYADGIWTALSTDCTEEENMNIGARADLDGEGLYVLMAKPTSVGGVQTAQNLTYTQSTDLDAVVTVSFDDPNTTSRYYNVYYSESYFTDKNADGVVVRSFDAGSTDLTINLLERGRTVFAAVEIVLEDGRRSDLSEIILIGGEADSDGDGIPDWYCDKYHLWGEEGEDKDIAGSDDDGDGLTNLEEYQGGSDPTDPNDPVHTTNVPVESISVSQSSVTLSIGETTLVTASVLPENATNKNVNWSSADPSVATVTVGEYGCTITAVASGETTVYAVSADGGYSAAVSVTVSACPGGAYGDSLTWTLIDGVLTISGTGAMPDYNRSALIPWKDYRDEIHSVVIGDGITNIGQFAFYYCVNLTDVAIPDSVTMIGSYAFYYCESLSEITLPDNLTGIDSSAFKFCTALTEIMIPDQVTRIGAHAFRECSALTEITLPESLTEIASHALRSCTSLTAITLPGGLETLGAYAFQDCAGLDTVAFTGDAPTFGTSVFLNVATTARYPAGNATWTADVMQNYGGTITWESSILASGYSGYTTWTLTADGVLTISGNGAMRNYGVKTAMPWYNWRDRITAVVITEGVTSVGDLSFYGLTALKSVSIPASVGVIGDYAFKNCTSLTSVTLRAGRLTEIRDSAFYGTALTELTVPAGVTTIGGYAFKNCQNLTAVSLPATLETLGESAFYGCTGLTQLTIPDQVRNVGDYCFSRCTSLTETASAGDA